jgi:hypothetical protein
VTELDLDFLALSEALEAPRYVTTNAQVGKIVPRGSVFPIGFGRPRPVACASARGLIPGA